eukprot:TRINITY_DN26919_c0_g1_i1.p1 TRINITY_DN26919_c0_g1~~TRINITY_DN26919_c0_g1_i1.p1  ORF type:complete len:417 (-),score=90.99 TRINITY_DN26919_c0_g1_i1:117-1367(-)
MCIRDRSTQSTGALSGNMERVVQKVTVPDDNDCLFSALAYLTSEDATYSPAGNMVLRKYCAEIVASDPELYAEWVLGMENAAYQQWIVNKFNWGGENEIIIIGPRKFKLEVCVVSMESFTTLVYGADGEDLRGRVYLLYTGQHYEPLVAAWPEGCAVPEGQEGHQRVWPVGPDPATETACIEVARVVAVEKARKAAQRSKKVLKCGGCGALCDDTDAFQVHCGEVEHDDEFMFDCSEVEVVLEADEQMDPNAIDLTSDSTAALYNHPSQPLACSAPGFPIEVDGLTYPSVMHFWHCSKFTPLATSPNAQALTDLQAKIRAAETSEDAERVATYSDCTTVNWDSAAKREAALVGMRAKFVQHSSACDTLLATADKRLVFLDQDTWAGVDNTGGLPKGKNTLGEVLQQVRGELQKPSV